MAREMTDLYVQSSIAEFEYDGDDFDKYYLPGRALCFQVAKPDSLVVLPAHPELKRYHQLFMDVLAETGFNPKKFRQPAFVPDTDYLLDKSIMQSPESIIEHLKLGENYRLYPYATTEPLLEWVNYLKSRGYLIDVALPKRVYYDDLSHPAHRGGWGRNVRTPDQQSFPELIGVPYPTSFVGLGLEEVVEAYHQVSSRTCDNRAFFKPVFSAGGFTLKEVQGTASVIDHYNALKQAGSLNILEGETPIEIQGFIYDIKKVFCLHYDGTNISTPQVLSEQLLYGHSWAGNLFNYGEDLAVINQAKQYFDRIAKGLDDYNHARFFGWGGLDFALSEGENPENLVLIEHNGQRINGGHPAIALAQGLSIDNCYITQKAPGNPECDLATLWQNLEELKFNPYTKKGIFPIIWMKGSGILLAADTNACSARGSLDKVYNRLAQKGYLKK